MKVKAKVKRKVILGASVLAMAGCGETGNNEKTVFFNALNNRVDILCRNGQLVKDTFLSKQGLPITTIIDSEDQECEIKNGN